jgi:hypothetical protein
MLTHKGSTFEGDILIINDAINKLPLEGSYDNIIILLIGTVDACMARIDSAKPLQHNGCHEQRQSLYVTEMGLRRL